MCKRFTQLSLFLALVLAGTSSTQSLTPAALPAGDKAIVHLLNRLTFGPRPGDVERVRQLGVQRYIDTQLHPERMADPAIDAPLAGLNTTGMSAQEIVREFEVPQIEARRQRQQTARNGNDAQPPALSPDMQRRTNQLVLELSQQKVLRAIYSERQLEEVLTDFWFNHFNVDARK